MNSLTYAAVIATRNRPEALKLSLPLLLSQSRPPAQVIVVDSSDDHGPIREIVDRAAAASGQKIRFIESSPGTSLQRNLGLAEVMTDVTFFPDDDSLLPSGTMAEIMQIYELDGEGLVGGVCSAEALSVPPELARIVQGVYSVRREVRLMRVILRLRRAIEARLFPDPFLYCAAKHYRTLRKPDWLETQNAVLVDWMTGFRMSFRTEVIRKLGFDEALGRYALFEDTDASFQTLRTHALVGARNAKIYHHKAPERRGAGRELGAVQILNRAYVVAKTGNLDARLTGQIRRYALYKILLYALRIDSAYGRSRLRGAWAAYRGLSRLLGAPPDRLTETYLAVRAECLGGT